jgi:mutator protein MutT
MDTFNPVSIGIFIKDFGPSQVSLWMQRREPEQKEDAFRGLWEFPGGKVEGDETPKNCLVREVSEEVGVSIPQESLLKLFKIHRHMYKEKEICLYVYISPFKDIPESVGEWKILDLEEKASKQVEETLPANYAIIDELLNYLNEQVTAKHWDILWK